MTISITNVGDCCYTTFTRAHKQVVVSLLHILKYLISFNDHLLISVDKYRIQMKMLLKTIIWFYCYLPNMRIMVC